MRHDTLAFALALLSGCSSMPTEALRVVGPVGDAGVDAPAMADSGAAPTWSEHVAPIVFAKCASCHRAGGIGPFPLITYDDARPMAGSMRDETRARRMPPTVINASGSCNSYRSDVSWLSSSELDTIARWADAGAPQGDPSRAPAPPTFRDGLEGADTRFDIGTSFRPVEGRTDQYRCFLADPALATDRFITGYQVVPGDTRVVHHVIVYTIPTAEAEREAQALDAADPLDGYTCFGGPGVTGSAPLVLWAPGGEAVRFPEGTGFRIAGGRRVVIQVHYNTLNGIFPDRTTVQLRTAPSVTSEARLLAVSATDINIPPRTAMTLVEGARMLAATPQAPRGVRVFGVAPHMHELGRTQRLTAGSTCLGNVDQWNFHWQRLFFYDRPLDLDPGVMLRLTCGYDSTSRTATTRRGEGTNDEMCLSYLYVTAR